MKSLYRFLVPVLFTWTISYMGPFIQHSQAVYMEYIQLLFFLCFSVFAGFQRGEDRIICWVGLIVSYWIYFFLASFGWFYSCSDWCAVAFYPIQIIFSGILFFCFFLSYFLSYLFRRKKKPPVNSLTRENPLGDNP